MSDQTLLPPTRLWQRLVAHLRTPLFANGYALLLSNAAASGLGFVYWALAARYYAAEAVGLNSAAIAALLFLTGIAALYLDGALVRFLPRMGRQTRSFIGASYLLSASVAALVAAVFLLGLNLWSADLTFLRATPWWSVAFVVSTVASTLFLLQDGVLTGLRRTAWVPLGNGLYSLAKIIVLLLLAPYYPDSGIFISWVAPLLLMLLPVNWLIFRRLLPARQLEDDATLLPMPPRQVAHYAGGLYVGFLFSLAATRLLPIIVLGYVGATVSAYFYLPWMIASALQLITPSLTTSLTVEGARDPSGLTVYSRRTLKQAARLVIPVSLLLALGAPYYMQFFGADYAENGTRLMQLLALASIPHIVNGLYIGVARVQRRIGGVVLVQATILTLLLALSHFLLPRLGITGVGWAWLASQTFVASLLLLQRTIRYLHRQRASRGERGPKHAPYDKGPLQALAGGLHRIHIVGGPGSGKTTLAMRLGAQLDLPVYQLDHIAFVGVDFAERALEERLARTSQIAQQQAWITEGIFLSWVGALLERADIIIWLDQLTWRQALWRIVYRFAEVAWQDARRQRRPHEFLRFGDYARNLRLLGGVFVSSHSYYQPNGAGAESRESTARCLQAYNHRVIRCRTPEEIEALVQTAAAYSAAESVKER